jgi:hypothetical protein
MNRSRVLTARSAVLAGVAATAALALAGCGGSSSGGSSAGNQAAGGSSGSPGASPSASSQSSGGGISTAAYYPIAAGYTWVYTENGFGGKGTSTNKVVSVTPTSAGQKAVMSATVTYPEKKTTLETLIFRPDGSIQVPLTQFANSSVTLESGAVLWPSEAQLASGQPYTNTIVMKIDEDGHSQTMRMPLSVKGEGTSSVTVPAGTYQATLIDETMSSSVDGYKFSLAVRTWVASGIGPVKSEVLTSGSSSPLTSEELLSFTK